MSAPRAALLPSARCTTDRHDRPGRLAPVVRLALSGVLAAGVVLPVLGVAPALAAAPAAGGVAAPVPGQARVEPVPDACAVRVTLAEGEGDRSVLVEVRTAAPTTPADRPVPLADEGRWTARAGDSREWPLDLGDARPGDPQGQRVEVAVTVDDGPVERTQVWLASCTSASPSASPTPGAGASPTPSAAPGAAPSATPSATPSAVPVTASPSATATATTSPPASPSGAPPASPPAAPPVPPALAPPALAAPAAAGSGVAAGPLLVAPGALAAPAATGSTPLVAAAPAVATVGTLAVPAAAAAAPLSPQVAAGPVDLFPAPPPSSEQDAPLLALRMAGPGAAGPEAGAVADLLPAGTALALSVAALAGLVRRRRA